MTGAFDQLHAETRWLRGEMPGSFLAPRKNWRPSREITQTAERALEILQRHELAKFRAVLEKCNRGRGRPFLLGPYLFQIIESVEERWAMLGRYPLLGRPAAEVRDHIRHVSTDAKALASLLRKGPQPHIALSARCDAWDAFALMWRFPIIQSPSEAATIVPLDELLNSIARDLGACKIPRAKQHNQPAKKEKRARQHELRLLAASILVEVLRRELKHPYHNHVATIAEALSGISTDADYVKKVEKRREA
jgi:hypothetical protein